MKKSTIIIALSAVLLVGALGYSIYKYKYIKVSEVKYQEIPVTKGNIVISFTTDALVQGDIISITAPVFEKVTEMKVAVGSNVTVGQHLFSVDNAKLKYQYNAAMATFSKAVYERNQIDKSVKPDSYSAAQQVVNSTYAQVQIAKLALNQARVTSPVKGVVAEVNVHAGEYPTQGQESIVKIVKSNSIFVTTSLDETEIGKITINTPVTINLEALGKNVQGKIASISPIAIKDSAGYSVYPVNILLNDKTLPIQIGFEGNAQFITKEINSVIQIPVNSVFIENGTSYVNKKTQSGSEKAKIVTGFTDGKVVEVTEGLTSNDIILIKQ